MVPIYFSALLKTEDGQLLEVGEACVSDADDAINFVNNFVPLMKLGETAQIVRVLGDRELECFVGSVYLSSSNLLRIVSVDAKLVTEARRLFTVNESISASLILAPGRTTMFQAQKAERVSGVIRYLSLDIIKMFSMEYVAEGQYLMFSLDAPSIQLNNMLVRVKERVLLKRNAALHLCEIVSVSKENKRALAAYATRKKQEPSA